jgi:hypothetical protein
MDRKRIGSFVIASSAMIFVSVGAFAQSEQAAEPVYEEETSYDFSDDYVEGQLVRPDGDLITGQRHGKQSSLIRIRADFIPEMVQSVEDL